MNRNIMLLDCTLRDGGFEFEDAENYGMSFGSFTPDAIKLAAECLVESDIDIIELGLIEPGNSDRRCYAIYNDINCISESIPKDRSSGQIFTAMYRGPDIPAEQIPEWNPSLCDGIRVMMRYSELQKSIDFCRLHAEKGYKVFIQPSVTMRYSDEEIQSLIDAANEMDAYALYIVDTYGYMHASDVKRLFELYDRGLKPSVRIGLHAHNNMGLAFSNVISFLGLSSLRNVIVDSCAMGFGQGAGNLQTEVIADYMNSNYGKQYNYPYILELCEIINSYYAENISGYSVPYFLSARHKTAYRYAVNLRKNYGLSFKEIDFVLSHIDEETRHRCTYENTIRLLRKSGFKIS